MHTNGSSGGLVSNFAECSLVLFFYFSSVHPCFFLAFTHLVNLLHLVACFLFAVIVLKQEIFVLVSCIILIQGLAKIQRYSRKYPTINTKLSNKIFNNYSSSQNGNQNAALIIDHSLDFTKVLYSTTHYRSLLKYLEIQGAPMKKEYDAVGKSAEPYHLNESQQFLVVLRIVHGLKLLIVCVKGIDFYDIIN